MVPFLLQRTIVVKMASNKFVVEVEVTRIQFPEELKRFMSRL
jgi:hypothetical protein